MTPSHQVIQNAPCPQCGLPPRPGRVLVSWHPFKCGGHHYRYCRDDKGGCGHTMYAPPMTEGCVDPVNRPVP
jgi:hypothetical protein